MVLPVTADDIALLSDKDLRTLVTLLCEAEARKRSLPTSCVTSGGHQDAPDGGVDVRVAFDSGTAISGFIPRPKTVFQVKAQTMPRTAILSEMRPAGELRAVIRELASESGAYVIVSSKDNTADPELSNRRRAMAEAVASFPEAASLALDFYDASRVATWVRDHSGLLLWVREKIGKPLRGWQSYGPWAYAAGGIESEYLFDAEVRVHGTRKGSQGGFSALQAIEHIRALLQQPGSAVRLLGLSGAGKTRLAQALFDPRIGEGSLDSSLVFYTDTADEPDPSPIARASSLVAQRTRAILIVDNCPADLHRRLAEICRLEGSEVSVVTIEYDIRDDAPEATEVFTLAASSKDVTERLMAARFPDISFIDRCSIAEFSEGNARVAIMLAETLGRNETLAGMPDDVLFRRLFHQRHGEDESLLAIGEACSLVCSFNGEDETAEVDSELARLSGLIGQSPQQVFWGVAQLKRRGLVQQRGVWRAVLPQAVADRLAKAALQDIPASIVEAQLVNNAPERLLTSFSRRLGYLHDSEEARKLVTRWLRPGGLLAKPAELDEIRRQVFRNIAPVVPALTLETLERAFSSVKTDEEARQFEPFCRLVLLLAYDAVLFERCAKLLSRIVVTGDVYNKSNEAVDSFSFLFAPYFSDTHATVEQRLQVTQALLLSSDARYRYLGLRALKNTLETVYFVGRPWSGFGARSRDYGYQPRTESEQKHWYRSVLTICEALGCSDAACAADVREAVTEAFHGLWSNAQMYGELERVCEAISRRNFWPEGWIAVRRTYDLDFEESPPEVRARLDRLESSLRPVDLIQSVEAVVLGQEHTFVSLPDSECQNRGDAVELYNATQRTARQLGYAAGAAPEILTKLLPRIVRGRGQHWAFGAGLAEGAQNAGALWTQMADALRDTPESERALHLFCGFLHALHGRDEELANGLLDSAVEDRILGQYAPVLQTAVPIGTRGVDRLLRCLSTRKAPIQMYRHLSVGRATCSIDGEDLKRLLIEIADARNGLDVALDILGARIHGEDELGVVPSICDAGRQLLGRLNFRTDEDSDDYQIGEISKYCLVGPEGAEAVYEICRKLKHSASKFKTHGYQHDDLLQGMFRVQPMAALDALLSGDTADIKTGVRLIQQARDTRKNPLDAVGEDVLLDWCDRDPLTRYVTAAAVITIGSGLKETGPQRWTEIALRLLDKAPNRVGVLERFVSNFEPAGAWSGMRSGVIETNVTLLDQLPPYADAALAAFIEQTKLRISRLIDAERAWEAQIYRSTDERFE